MDCHKCSEELTALLDGELAESAANAVRSHLEACPPCREEYRDLNESAAFIERHAAELDPIPEIWNNLRARISEMPPPAAARGFFPFLILNRWVAATATLGATLVLFLGMWGYMQYRASDREFQAFVSEYLLQRSIEERIHALQIRQARNMASGGKIIRSAFPENPFSELRPASVTNPFQPEER